MGKIFYLILCSLFVTSLLSAQITIVKNGKPKARIVTLGNSVDVQAATLLQDFVKRISNAHLPIVEVSSSYKSKKGDITIGDKSILPSAVGTLKNELSEDGFLLFSSENQLRIVSGGDKGAIYGVVTLLENYLGVDYWAQDEYSLSRQKTIKLPFIQEIEIPTFHYRQSQSYAMKDPIYKMWYRFEEPNEVFANSHFVHTFNRLLPAERYGKEHPEYYAYYNGKRHPGQASQWCLTNPEVLEIVATRIDSIFKANPDKHILSVSQNDGNYTHCTCPNCKAIDDREGALSGSLITFMNKLAVRFPDKELSTLAYLYTMNPPKYIKPLPNVNIMLCNIDCNREVSLEENATGQYFMEAMKKWAAISDNLFLWDYGINFDNYLAPFPNFHILQDNIRLFEKYNVTMHFSQIAGSWGGDFTELRAYLVSKLMWNHDADVDALMQHFLNGYYGEAGPAIYRYIKVMEGALIGSGLRLWIYDSPVSHKDGMLKATLMRRYNALFDEAESYVAEDAVLLRRVQRARLPLQYSELEIVRTQKEKDLDDVNQKLDLLEERVKESKVLVLNERSNSPLDYCRLYRERYMPRDVKNLAQNATITYLEEPTGNYKKLGTEVLSDGLFGGSSFVESWIGWEGKDGSLVIDLGEEKTIHSIETDFLHQLGQWILFPKEVTYSYSSDGITYQTLENHKLIEDQDVKVKFKAIRSEIPQGLKTRYLKVDIVGTKICPEWHYGVGNLCWFFIDEITVL